MENKMWLNTYLEEVVKFAFTEVNEIKTEGQKCFPSGYNILKFFVEAHHRNLADVVCVCVIMYKYKWKTGTVMSR